MLDNLVKDSQTQVGQKIQKKELGQQINQFLENLEKFQLLDTDNFGDDFNSRVSQDSAEMLNNSKVFQPQQHNQQVEESKSLNSQDQQMNILDQSFSSSFYNRSGNSQKSFLKNELQMVINKNFGNKSFVKQLVQLTKEANNLESLPSQPPVNPLLSTFPQMAMGGPSPFQNIAMGNPLLMGQMGQSLQTPQDQSCQDHKKLIKQYSQMLSVLLQTMNDIIEVAPEVGSEMGDTDHDFDIESNIGSD